MVVFSWMFLLEWVIFFVIREDIIYGVEHWIRRSWWCS